MKAYCVYPKDYPESGAALVFARNGNEARRVGFWYLRGLYDPEWPDIVASSMAGDTRGLAIQEGVDLESLDAPFAVQRPKGCDRCECIALINGDGLCLSCEEEEDDECCDS